MIKTNNPQDEFRARCSLCGRRFKFKKYKAELFTGSYGYSNGLAIKCPNCGTQIPEFFWETIKNDS